jgi:Helix-turn-helix domain
MNRRASPFSFAVEQSPDRLFLTTNDAAALLRISPRSLERRRQDGSGPPFCRIGGCVRYLLADLLAWADSQKALSTSDRPTA